jgi:hypothetical protein
MRPFVGFLIGVAACTQAGTDAAPVPPPAQLSVARATIGPLGGAIEHASGARLELPAGAVEREIEIAMTGAIGPAAAELGALPLAQAYVVDPALPLARPARLTIPLARASDRAHVYLAGDAGFVALASEGTSTSAAGSTLRLGRFTAGEHPNPIRLATDVVLAPGTVAAPYATVLRAGQVEPGLPLAWSAASPPPGLTLDPGGALTGAPSASGIFFFSARARAHTTAQALEATFVLAASPARHPDPILAAVEPASILVDTDHALRVTGEGFVPRSQARWDGKDVTTVVISSTLLWMIVPRSLTTAGSHDVTVTSPPPGGGVTETRRVDVGAAETAPLPVLFAITPREVPAGSGDTLLALSGSGFTRTTRVLVAGSETATTFVDASRIVATVPASLLAAPPHAVKIAAKTPPPGGGTSAELELQVR